VRTKTDICLNIADETIKSMGQIMTKFTMMRQLQEISGVICFLD